MSKLTYQYSQGFCAFHSAQIFWGLSGASEMTDASLILCILTGTHHLLCSRCHTKHQAYCIGDWDISFHLDLFISLWNFFKGSLKNLEPSILKTLHGRWAPRKQQAFFYQRILGLTSGHLFMINFAVVSVVTSQLTTFM